MWNSPTTCKIHCVEGKKDNERKKQGPEGEADGPLLQHHLNHQCHMPRTSPWLPVAAWPTDINMTAAQAMDISLAPCFYFCFGGQRMLVSTDRDAETSRSMTGLIPVGKELNTSIGTVPSTRAGTKLSSRQGAWKVWTCTRSRASVLADVTTVSWVNPQKQLFLCICCPWSSGWSLYKLQDQQIACRS